jgi:hypothetical protein
VPAQLIEERLEKALQGASPAAPRSNLDVIARVRVLADRLIVTLKPEAEDSEDIPLRRLTIPLLLASAAGRTQVARGSQDGPRHDPILIRAFKRAHAKLEPDVKAKPMLHSAPDHVRERRILRLAFLAPDLQKAILEGRQPPGLTLAHLLECDIPLAWSEHKKLFATLS